MELMSPIDALFLSAESREHPLHVGALQLFEPPAGAGRGFVRETYQAMLQCREIAPLFRKRPTSLHGALINLGWSTDADVDLGYHARRSALPAPGRVRELLELTSRLHSNLLDRHRPLWETHVIEGLRDGRFAIYSKMHHALVDGVSGLTLMRQPSGSSFAERSPGVVVVAEGQQVECDEGGWCAVGKHSHPRLGRMDALLQRLEVQAVVGGDDDLPVDHTAMRQLGPDRGDQLGEVAGHRPLVAATQFDLITVAKADGAESVPFGFIRRVRRDCGDRFGQHRRHRRHDG